MDFGSSESREHYELADGRYVLFVEDTCILATSVVALLIYLPEQTLITHGDPDSVRAEWKALAYLAHDDESSEVDGNWLFLEGRPPLALLNQALRESGALLELRTSLIGNGQWYAERLTRQLIQRLLRPVSIGCPQWRGKPHTGG